MFKFLITKYKLKFEIHKSLAKRFVERRFYKLVLVNSVLSNTGIEEQLGSIPYACFCYEDDYNKYFELEKKSDYRAIRKKYGYNAKRRRKSDDSGREDGSGGPGDIDFMGSSCG